MSGFRWLWLCACLGACTGTLTGDAAGSGGKGGSGSLDKDAGSDSGPGNAYDGDAGAVPALDTIQPAQCAPDPTEFEPCGGDVVGRWRRATSCFPSGIEDVREEYSCPSIEQELVYNLRELVELEGNGKYSIGQISGVTQVFTFPTACIPDFSDCSQFRENDTDDTDGETLLVTSSGNNCILTVTARRAGRASGTWQAEGTSLTLTDSVGPDVRDYCVNGNTLTVRKVDEYNRGTTWGVYEKL
jgi:hypothetical protein